MQYLLMIYGDETKYPDVKTDAEREAMIAPWIAYNEALKKAGAFVAGDALQRTSTATTVSEQSGTMTVTDGPFAETKEQLGGYYLLECADLDEALGWAKKCPAVSTGKVEVRPIMDFGI